LQIIVQLVQVTSQLTTNRSILAPSPLWDSWLQSETVETDLYCCVRPGCPLWREDGSVVIRRVEDWHGLLYKLPL